MVLPEGRIGRSSVTSGLTRGAGSSALALVARAGNHKGGAKATRWHGVRRCVAALTMDTPYTWGSEEYNKDSKDAKVTAITRYRYVITVEAGIRRQMSRRWPRVWPRAAQRSLTARERRGRTRCSVAMPAA
jgi:hypothetical protein